MCGADRSHRSDIVTTLLTIIGIAVGFQRISSSVYILIPSFIIIIFHLISKTILQIFDNNRCKFKKIISIQLCSTYSGMVMAFFGSHMHESGTWIFTVCIVVLSSSSKNVINLSVSFNCVPWCWWWLYVVIHRTILPMGILPDTLNCGLRMRRECRQRFPAWRTCRDACRDH